MDLKSIVVDFTNIYAQISIKPVNTSISYDQSTDLTILKATFISEKLQYQYFSKTRSNIF